MVETSNDTGLSGPTGLEVLLGQHLLTSDVGILVVNKDMQIVWHNRSAGEVLDLAPGQYHPFPAWQKSDGTPGVPGDHPCDLVGLTSSTKGIVWVQGSCSAFGEFNVFQFVKAQATARHLSDLSYQEGIWRWAVEAAGHGVWDFNSERVAVFVSEEWGKMRGFSDEQSRADGFNEWISRLHPDDVDYCIEKIRQHNEGEVDIFEFEYREKHTSGEYVWIHCCGRVVERDANGKPIRLVGVDIDITRLKLEEEKRALEMAALHSDHIKEIESAHERTEVARQVAHGLARQDPLTQLPNRRVFADEIERLSAAKKDSDPFAVLIIDLDRFKPINDLYGHSVGDLVIQAAGHRILKALGANGLATRLGGDEFGVIVPVGSKSAVQAAQNCARVIIEALSEPIGVNDFSVMIGASVGIALYPEHGEDQQTLFRHADMALYAVKQSDRGGVKLYNDTLGHEAEAKVLLENAVRDAVAHDAIKPFFQPIFDLKSGKVKSLEILARWHDPVLGSVSPENFIPIIDQFNLTPQFTISILQQACIMSKSWPEDISLCMNLTAKEVCDLSTPIRIFKLLADIGFDPNRLKIEVTEHALLKDLFAAKQVVAAFRSAGVNVVLDDFGTGYAGLGYLRELKFDCIKIDRSFVMNMLRQRESATIIEAMQNLANNLGLETVAEGIEDLQTLEALKKLGCHAGQGYYFAQAVACEYVPDLLLVNPAQYLKTA